MRVSLAFPNDGLTFVPAFPGDVGASAAIGEVGWVPAFAGDVVVSDGFGGVWLVQSWCGD
jgi:hypothetical protein